MGVVYKGREESLNRFVAIKVLTEKLSEGPTYLQRFVREAQAAASLSHPNVVQIYFTGQDDEAHPYFVMEFVPAFVLLAGGAVAAALYGTKLFKRVSAETQEAKSEAKPAVAAPASNPPQEALLSQAITVPAPRADQSATEPVLSPDPTTGRESWGQAFVLRFG